MRTLLISVIVVLFSLYLLPSWIPVVMNHAFSLGELSIKWMHLIALGLVVMVFRGGR